MVTYKSPSLASVVGHLPVTPSDGDLEKKLKKNCSYFAIFHAEMLKKVKKIHIFSSHHHLKSRADGQVIRSNHHFTCLITLLLLEVTIATTSHEQMPNAHMYL